MLSLYLQHQRVVQAHSPEKPPSSLSITIYPEEREDIKVNNYSAPELKNACHDALKQLPSPYLPNSDLVPLLCGGRYHLCRPVENLFKENESETITLSLTRLILTEWITISSCALPVTSSKLSFKPSSANSPNTAVYIRGKITTCKGPNTRGQRVLSLLDKKGVTQEVFARWIDHRRAGRSEALLTIPSELELVSKLIPTTANPTTLSGDDATTAATFAGASNLSGCLTHLAVARAKLDQGADLPPENLLEGFDEMTCRFRWWWWWKCGGYTTTQAIGVLRFIPCQNLSKRHATRVPEREGSAALYSLWNFQGAQGYFKGTELEGTEALDGSFNCLKAAKSTEEQYMRRA
ncbi:hypothetical protein EV702DRAFT_1047072 [Suillus placidus]|uniref:Uncharacterized protein n=1 Tax=Suillus placidus TaxID=48579 RepID=A0A9P6ZR88_9AGAM|nr:hypothetical protein EV702DRAFT_1047072 [Suillus placidus]